ncbi:MAG: leucyl aminopeptidase [Bacteroidia bacterium]|nr:leucyl aminopeptidase [Bacteroidia bacterium]MDW8157615.1 leucyl aminopeptidase [Bacteroidia bacterium]
MKVTIIQQLENNIFTAIFVDESTFKATIKYLPSELLEYKTQEEFCKEEAINLYFTTKYQFIIYALPANVTIDKLRRKICTAISTANQQKVEVLQIVCLQPANIQEVESLGITLGELPYLCNYQFLKYKREAKEANTLQEIRILTDVPNVAVLVAQGEKLGNAVCIARDWVNEPPNVLNAVTLAQSLVEAGEKYGFKVEVFDKNKIQELKMGGLLAVNRGSKTPPTFSILEYKPQNALNQQPIVLVGKGITFDTGGLSLKPTTGSMDSMKSDMAGAAAVGATFIAIASNQLPYYVVGLVPATDNRPAEDAYTPNDVITMYDGTTVEVLNTDAEGRMILADALSFAKQYNPAIVIDLATLTGSAAMAVGTNAIVMCATADRKVVDKLIEAGYRVHERLVELPLWEDYKEMLKSDIADMKNIGGKYAGAITAAKFLEHFTNYPWVHLDIAGPAFLEKPDSYRGKNATGVGVRLLYEFIRNYQV